MVPSTDGAIEKRAQGCLPHFLRPNEIETLWDAMGSPDLAHSDRDIEAAVDSVIDGPGFVLRHSLDHLLLRFGQFRAHGIVSCIEIFGLRWASIAFTPKSKETTTSLYDGLSDVDFVSLLVMLQRLGCPVDAGPAVEAFRPKLAGRKMMTTTELNIWLYPREWHRQAPITMTRGETPHERRSTERRTSDFVLARGHRAAVTSDIDGITEITVKRPVHAKTRRPGREAKGSTTA